MSSQARSSSASHYATNFATATVGKAEESLYGLILNNDLTEVPLWQTVGLVILLGIVILKPSMKRPELSTSFWVAVAAVSFVWLKDVTLVPFLSTVVYTRTSYPYLVVIPHCIAANASYRSACGDKENRVRALLFSFILYGFGGSIVSDVLMGLPVTALGHPRIVPCHILGWALIWYSPMDFVYSSYMNPQSFLHYFIVVFEAIDAVTTPMGRIARGARELRNKTTAPIMGGIFAGIGGACLRLLAGKGTFDALEGATFKTTGYSLLFASLVVFPCDNGWLSNPTGHHCESYNGSDLLRVVFVLMHVVWTLMVDTGLATGHPFIWLAHRGGAVLQLGAKLMHLGPNLEDKFEEESLPTPVQPVKQANSKRKGKKKD